MAGVTTDTIRGQKPLWLSFNDLAEGTNNPVGDNVTVDGNGIITGFPQGDSNRPHAYNWANILNLCTIIEKSHTHDGLHTSKLTPADMVISSGTSPEANQCLTYVDANTFKWTTINTLDEKVKLSSTCPSAKYLSELIDNDTIKVNTANHTIAVDSAKYALAHHGHVAEDISNLNTYLGVNYLLATKEDFAHKDIKSTLNANDIVLIEDSQDEWKKKQAKISAVLSTVSDIRLKHDIQPLNYGLKDIDLLNPILYKLNNDTKDTQYLGLIAQEVDKVIPEVVVHGNEYLSLRYDLLVPVLINAIKELNAEVTNLRKQLKL